MKLRALCKLIDGRNWLWGKLGLALVIRAILSTPLIPFSADGWGCVLSLSGLRPNCGRSNGKLLRKDLGLGLLYSVPLTPLQSLLTHASAGDSQTLTGKSLVESVPAPFSWVLVCIRFCLCPPRVLFPLSCGSSVIKSH